MEQEKARRVSEEDYEPPPYETIMDIPDGSDMSPPPAYSDREVIGLPYDQEYPSPENVQVVKQQHLPFLAYADILPRLIHPGNPFTYPKFDDMKTLMAEANQWIAANTQFTVVRCESIERKVDKDGQLETETTVRFETTNTSHQYVRGIRLWLNHNVNGAPAQHIWYMNVVPQLITVQLPVGMSATLMGRRRDMMCHVETRSPSFENLDQLLHKLNARLANNPIPGRILTVESIDMKFSENYRLVHMNPERSSWFEKASTDKLYLKVLRIFFVSGPPEKAEIGIMDFTPLCRTNSSSVLSQPKFELFSDTMQRVHDWINIQKDKRITNMQTVTTKLLNRDAMGIEVEYDANHMDFTMGFGRNTFIKVIRVPFVKTLCSTNPRLTSKTFVPVRYGEILSETTSQTIHRINQWLSCTGAKVFSVETLEYEFTPQNHHSVDIENVRNTKMRSHSHYWISTIRLPFRLYIDGQYTEPPPEVLPPVPAYVSMTPTSTSGGCTVL